MNDDQAMSRLREQLAAKNGIYSPDEYTILGLLNRLDALTAEIAALRLEKDGSAGVANSGAPSAPSETWRLVPVEPTPEIVARVAVQTELPSTADFAVAVEALKLAPQTDHPDARTILAEIARDYRHAIAARPLPLGASKGVTPGDDNE